eukprot:scpid77212/ scgid31700/ Heparanase-like protein 3
MSSPRLFVAPITTLLIALLAGHGARGVELAIGSASAAVALEFRSFTADWWRHNDPRNGDRWQWAGMMTLDVKNTTLRNLAKGLVPAIWRIGGSPEDDVVYVVGNPPECNSSEVINKSVNYPGPICLTMERWAEILDFVNYTGLRLAFGLNGLYQRHKADQHFNSTNAREFLRYTAQNFPNSVYAFELSNEDNHGQADPDKLAEDFGTVRGFINEFWPDAGNRPLLFGPDVGQHLKSSEDTWLASYIKIAGPYLNRSTVHTYCNTYVGDLCEHGSVRQPELDNCTVPELSFKGIVNTNYPGLPVMAGEVGPHSHGGLDGCTNTFANAFWYLEVLGSLAQNGVVTFARSTMIGGWYEMINKTSFEPNPDYFLALFWGRLMGRVHLKTSVDASTAVRGFASCRALGGAASNAGAGAGITVALYNSGNTTTETVTLSGLKFDGSGAAVSSVETHVRTSGSSQFSWYAEMLQSSGDWAKLAVGSDGTPGEYPGVTTSKSASKITVDLQPMSYAFVHFPTAACPLTPR